MFRRLKIYFLNATIRKKIVALVFPLVIITPTLLIAILVGAYYHYGIEPLFNNRIQKSVNQAVNIAQLYLKEHKENIRYDILAISNAIQVDENFFAFMRNPTLLSSVLNTLVEQRKLDEAVIFTHSGVVARNSIAYPFVYQSIPQEALKKADMGEVVILSEERDDKMQAVIKLEKFLTDTYIMIARAVDSNILNYLHDAKSAATLYNQMVKEIRVRKIKLTIIFVIAFVLLSIAALYSAFKLARIIAAPLQNLLEVTKSIRKGDYSVRLVETKSRDEINLLAKAFNAMTATIEEQRQALIHSNQFIEDRAFFIEKVLEGISSGVITLNGKKQVLYMNNYAKSLVSRKYSNIRGGRISKVAEEFEELLEKVDTVTADQIVQDNVSLTTEDGQLNLGVSIVKINLQEIKDLKYIITIDNLTDHMTAQRLSVWADVARRIAHEIKNPLTPIQLAAQRLNMKFANFASEETKPLFARYVDTITNHVDEIKRIVEDFVQFAKLPDPKLEKNDIIGIVDDCIFSQAAVFKNINYDFVKPKSLEQLFVECDKVLISQSIANVLKNAAESIATKYPDDLSSGHITVIINVEGNLATIVIRDNGLGFPPNKLDIITEPYVTTKPKGTGIGLAIVRKIIEDHNSTLKIANLKHDGQISGAQVSFSLSLSD